MAQRGGNIAGEIYKQHSRTMKKKEMSQDMDWQDFVEQLRKIGLELVTDVEWAEIPFYSCGVQAGLPNEPGDFAGETVTVPREWADCGYVVNVHGESMLDYDFREGDRLLVRSQKTAESGDIVIASVDGGMTVKAYYEDERGEKWLVPGNAKFNPIALSHYPNCCIMGRVMEVTHLDVRARMSDCVKRVNRWRGVSEGTKEDSAPVDVRDIAANEVESCEMSVAMAVSAVIRAERSALSCDCSVVMAFLEPASPRRAAMTRRREPREYGVMASCSVSA